MIQVRKDSMGVELLIEMKFRFIYENMYLVDTHWLSLVFRLVLVVMHSVPELIWDRVPMKFLRL